MTSRAIVYFLLVLSAAAACFKRPLYNWDILPYTGTVLSYEETDPQVIHARTYELARARIPEANLRRLTEESTAGRQHVASHAEHFYALLPFYKVKPLYTFSVYVVYKLGFGLVSATVLVSSFCYVVLAAVVFFWVTRHVFGWLGLIPATLVSMSHPALEAARLSAPDAMSACIVLAALYVMTVRRRILPVFALLVLAILARPDNVILAVLTLAYLWLAAPDGLRLRAPAFVAFLVVVAGVYLAATRAAGHCGWKVIFTHNFLQRMESPDDAVTISVGQYFRAVIQHGSASAVRSSFALFSLLGVLAWRLAWNRPESDQARLHVGVIALLALSIVIHFLLFPALWDRFFVAHYITISIVLMAEIAARVAPPQNHSHPAEPRTE